MHQRRRSTYVNRMNAIRYPERESENLSRKISSAMIIPEDEEEELELGPELVSDEEIFRNLDERLIQVMNDAMRKAIASHGPLTFSEEPEGLEGPRKFTEWKESEFEGEAGLVF